MRLAIPVWQSRISPVFDTATRLLVLDIESGCETARTEHPIVGFSPSDRVNRLSDLDVDVLLCGAISRPLANAIASSGIKLIPWMRGDVNGILEWYMAGKPLDSRFLMPCYRAAQRRRRLRGTRRRGFQNYRVTNQEEIQ